MKNTKEDTMREFDEVFPCIQSGCSNDGIIVTEGLDGQPEPEQCEFCYKIRFPVKEWIEKNYISRKIVEEEIEKLRVAGSRFLDDAVGFAEALDDLKQSLLNDK